MAASANQIARWRVIGHDRAVDRLQRLVLSEALPGAMLITGSPGIGRKHLALQMARATLCSAPEVERPCGSCDSCRLIESGSHPDVQVWSVARQDQELTESAAGRLRIETIRVIDSTSAIRPQLGSRRFVLIDDAETLAKDQQSAMLKMLEDAPPFLTIVLISTSSSAMINTVLSRCVELPLQLVPSDLIRTHMSGPDADEIVAFAAGRPGWALAASANPDLLAGEREAVAGLETWISQSGHERLIEAYRRGDLALDRDRKNAQGGRRHVLDDLDRLHRIWRDQVMTSAGVPGAVFNPAAADRIQANISVDSRDAYLALAATFTCQNDILGNVRPRLALQTMVNQWPTQ